MRKHYVIASLIAIALGVGAFAFNQLPAEAPLGAGPNLTYTEVPKEIVTEQPPVWEFSFKKNDTGQVYTMQVDQATYDAWFTKAMTIINNPPPALQGYTFLGSQGGVVRVSTSSPTLRRGEYYTLTPESATTSAVYVVNDGKNIFSTTTRP
jgi:hypothetical protein